MSQESISLFPGVQILSNLTKQHAIEYLKRFCAIDDLDDTIYVKKLGDNGTTFAIDFEFDEISTVRKIKDENGNNVQILTYEYEREIDDEDDDEIDYDDEDDCAPLEAKK